METKQLTNKKNGKSTTFEVYASTAEALKTLGEDKCLKRINAGSRAIARSKIATTARVSTKALGKINKLSAEVRAQYADVIAQLNARLEADLAAQEVAKAAA